METYLENILQNKEINKIVIYLGSKVDNKIFKQNEISKEQFLNIFKSYQIKQSIVNFYQAGNKIKTDDKYFKMVQIEDPDIVKNNSFEITSETDSLILFYNYSELKSHDFPSKLEYSVEGKINTIETNFIEQIKIKLIDEKYLQIELTKDAYMDNTIRELTNLIKLITPII
jgi:hypothetical protein